MNNPPLVIRLVTLTGVLALAVLLVVVWVVNRRGDSSPGNWCGSWVIEDRKESQGWEAHGEGCGRATGYEDQVIIEGDSKETHLTVVIAPNQKSFHADITTYPIDDQTEGP